MRVTTTTYRGAECWMFSPDESLDKRGQRAELTQLARLCRQRLGRSHGRLRESLWVAAHKSRYDGIGVSSTNVIFVRDPTVVFEATLMFC
jgi:hypothetical protein